MKFYVAALALYASGILAGLAMQAQVHGISLLIASSGLAGLAGTFFGLARREQNA
jgi:hypothetical protein